MQVEFIELECINSIHENFANCLSGNDNQILCKQKVKNYLSLCKIKNVDSGCRLCMVFVSVKARGVEEATSSGATLFGCDQMGSHSFEACSIRGDDKNGSVPLHSKVSISF